MDVSSQKNAHSIFGIFDHKSALEDAVQDLKIAGFEPADLSVLMGKNHTDHDQLTSEGIVAGAGTGILGGGVLGWLAAVGTLAIPGAGPFIAAGPIIAAIAGAGIGGTVGSLTGGLIGLGMSDDDASSFEKSLQGGGILLSVHVSTLAEVLRAREILTKNGARDIARAGIHSSVNNIKNLQPLPNENHL